MTITRLKKLTFAEFLQNYPEDGIYELVNGEFFALQPTRALNEVRSQKSEVRSCFCNGDLSPAPKTFRLKRQGFRPNYFDQ
jgi:hypothetical protein